MYSGKDYVTNSVIIILELLSFASRYSKILSTLRKTKLIICWPRTRNVSFPCKYVSCNHHISLSNANLQQCLRFYYLRSFLYDTSLLFFIAKFWQHFKISNWHYFLMAISCLLNSIESTSDLICSDLTPTHLQVCDKLWMLYCIHSKS